MTVSAVVVSHGHARELERSLAALAPQVDELVVVANVPGSVGAVPDGVRVLENERPVSFAANANQGFGATSGDYVGRKPLSDFCRRNMTVFKLLLDRYESDDDARTVFLDWAAR